MVFLIDFSNEFDAIRTPVIKGLLSHVMFELTYTPVGNGLIRFGTPSSLHNSSVCLFVNH